MLFYGAYLTYSCPLWESPYLQLTVCHLFSLSLPFLSLVFLPADNGYTASDFKTLPTIHKPSIDRSQAYLVFYSITEHLTFVSIIIPVILVLRRIAHDYANIQRIPYTRSFSIVSFLCILFSSICQFMLIFTDITEDAKTTSQIISILCSVGLCAYGVFMMYIRKSISHSFHYIEDIVDLHVGFPLASSFFSHPLMHYGIRCIA